jgi:hypothetical protein
MQLPLVTNPKTPHTPWEGHNHREAQPPFKMFNKNLHSLALQI